MSDWASTFCALPGTTPVQRLAAGRTIVVEHVPNPPNRLLIAETLGMCSMIWLPDRAAAQDGAR